MMVKSSTKHRLQCGFRALSEVCASLTSLTLGVMICGSMVHGDYRPANITGVGENNSNHLWASGCLSAKITLFLTSSPSCAISFFGFNASHR